MICDLKNFILEKEELLNQSEFFKSHRQHHPNRLLIDFADGFVCPVVLVGPDAETEITLNEPARLIAYRVGLDKKREKTTSLASHLQM